MAQVSPRRKIRDEVAEWIKDYIASHDLAPGDRLPSENEFAETYKVSRLSVREATKALEFLGIVESQRGIGLMVGEMDLARITDHLGFHPALQRSDALELLESRVIVETGVLPHVARRMANDPSIYAALQVLVDRFRTASTIQAWIDLDIQFHAVLLRSSGLGPLIAFGDLLQVFFRRFRDSVVKAEWKSSIESHQRIIDYLRDQDVTSATAALREHIESHKQRIGPKRTKSGK